MRKYIRFSTAIVSVSTDLNCVVDNYGYYQPQPIIIADVSGEPVLWLENTKSYPVSTIKVEKFETSERTRIRACELMEQGHEVVDKYGNKLAKNGFLKND